MDAQPLVAVLDLALEEVPAELRSPDLDQRLEAFTDEVSDFVRDFVASSRSPLDLDLRAFGDLAARLYAAPGYRAVASVVIGFLIGWLGAAGQGAALEIAEEIPVHGGG